jgi:hypothetical protein
MPSAAQTHPMKNFVKRENIRHYRQLLEHTTDPVERARIERLLAEEQVDDGTEGPRTHRENT